MKAKLLLKSFKLLLDYKPWWLVWIFLLSLLLGAGQGFSVVLLIPFLELLEVGTTEANNPLVNFFANWFEAWNISLRLENVLLIYVVVLGLIALITYGKYMLQSAYQQQFTYRIRRRLFRKIILSDWAELTTKSRHNHLQVLTEEVPKLSDYFHFYLQLLGRLLMLAAYLFYAYLISPGFTLLVAATGLAALILFRGYLGRARSLGRSYVAVFNNLLKYIDDFWASVKVAKVHHSEDVYYNKFEKASHDMLKLEYKMNQTYALPQLFYKLTGILILTVVIYAGYRLDQIPLSGFFILIILFARILPQFTGINNDLNHIFAYMGPVQMVLDLDEKLHEQQFTQIHTRQRLEVHREIKLRDIHFSYPGNPPVFQGLHAHIPALSFTGIVGETGSGKTTLIDIIAGLQQPEKGEVMVDGISLEGEKIIQWKNGLAYLPQQPMFIDGTIRDNLIWDNRQQLTDETLWESLRMVRAESLISKLDEGLDTFIPNYPFRFSGGECQKLALARVLLRQPTLLILDEATSSLDTVNEAALMEVISLLKKQVTIIMVTHRQSVFPWFDHVIKL